MRGARMGTVPVSMPTWPGPRWFRNMRKEDKIALLVIAIGLGITIAAMALPPATPEWPLWVWKILFWGGTIIAISSFLFLLYDLLIRPSIIRAPFLMRSMLLNVGYPIDTILGGIKWTPDLRDLRVLFGNPTDGDYQDLDITIRPDFPNITIIAIGQVSNLPDVSFVNPKMQAFQKPNGTPIVKFEETEVYIKGDAWKGFKQGPGSVSLRVCANHYRFRCRKLPHHTTLELTLAISKADIAKQNGKISNIWLKGQYYAQSRVRIIDKIIPVSN